MCVTLSQAQLSNTIVYTHSIEHQGRPAHVLGYQNRARSSGPNAMILPLPATDWEPVGPDNVIDTSAAPWLLEDMDLSSKATMRGGVYKSVSRGAVQVFDSGSYTIVLATDAEAVPEVLPQVPEAKRPQVRPEFFAAYGKIYPGWPIAVCCWVGTIKAEPMLWWFRPRFSDRLFFPTLDAHDGWPPEPGTVKRDHVLLWGADKGRYTPRYRDSIPEHIKPFVAAQTNALRPSSLGKNGDYWALLNASADEQLTQSYFEGYP